MKRIDITNGIMRIGTNTETFDIQKNPKPAVLV